MQLRGRRLRFTAVLALVVLALTGFSRGHGHSRHGGSGGGGCSSSHQDHDSSSSTTSGGGSYGGGSSYDDPDDDSYGSGYASSGSSASGSTGGYRTRPTHRATSTPSGSGKALEEGTARLISCASQTTPYATVEVTNPNSRKADFQVWVTFYDAEGTLLLSNESPQVSVPANGRATTRVTLGKRLLSSVDHCEADREARLRS
ncbi:hypothetical protein ABZ471_04040 [Streptomyces sp. NPDC005728]|uniref:hypothetical protein n=1 Tax=Streptomyces sp. NPDC005728 TaxID=3157054 RepID=UPI0033C3D012